VVKKEVKFMNGISGFNYQRQQIGFAANKAKTVNNLFAPLKSLKEAGLKFNMRMVGNDYVVSAGDRPFPEAPTMPGAVENVINVITAAAKRGRGFLLTDGKTTVRVTPGIKADEFNIIKHTPEWVQGDKNKHMF